MWQPKYSIEAYTSADCDETDDEDVIKLNQQLYPVGTVLITGRDNSPAEWICGLENTSWKPLTSTDESTGLDSMYALKASQEGTATVGETGGGSAYTFGDWEVGDCTLTADQLPDHAHTTTNDAEVIDDTHEHDGAWKQKEMAKVVESGDTYGSICRICSNDDCNIKNSYEGYNFQGEAPHTHKIQTEDTGGGHPHNHRLLIGYYKFYVWKRTE